jgi:hypothetical protein
MTDLIKILNNPEEHYPGNFDTPQRANALLTGLCQDAANEIAKLQAEVLEQCRINGMSAEREDALRAELTRLKASIALDWMAKNARELGLDYEPAPVQQGRDWSLLEATQESLREHMAEIKRLKEAQPAPVQSLQCAHCHVTIEALNDKAMHLIDENQRLRAELKFNTPPAPQPVPVKTYHDGKPWPVAPVPDGPYSAPIKELWPVAPKPWVGLTADEMLEALISVDPETKRLLVGFFRFARAIEIKLKELNHV